MNQLTTSSVPSTPAQPSPQPPPRPPVTSARVTVVVAVVWTLVMVVTAVIALVTKGDMQAWAEGTGGDSAGFMLLLGCAGAATLCMWTAWAAGAVWLVGLRRVAEAVAPERWYRRSVLWSVLGWGVPVVNLWFPLQALGDAMSALGVRARGLLPVWWATWLLALFGMNAGQALGGDLMSAQDVERWVIGHVIAAVVMVLALPGWLLVVRRSTAAAVERTATAGVR